MLRASTLVRASFRAGGKAKAGEARYGRVIQGLAMGLFSFLSGGKKKEQKAAPVKATAPEPVAAAPVVAKVAERKAEPPSKGVEPATPPVVVTATGVAQAKLRLKLAASLRAGQRAAAYEAATRLAEIQTRAGRPTMARVWKIQAAKIRAGMAA